MIPSQFCCSPIAGVHSFTESLRSSVQKEAPHIRVVEVMPRGVKGVGKGDHELHAGDVLTQIQQEVSQIGY